MPADGTSSSGKTSPRSSCNTLDRGDDDPGRLWWYVVCALQRARPEFSAGSITIQRSGLDKPEYRRTLAEQIGARARSRLFEMCTVIRMPLIKDYRVRKGKQF